MKFNISKKKLFILSVILPIIVFLLSFIIYKRSNYDFTIVFTSDVHSNIDQYLGYARLSTLIKDIEKKDRRPLVFDVGDTFTGSTEANLTEGQYIVDILNAVGYSALGLGNHDFVYPKSSLKKIISNLSFPVINTNILNEKGEHEFLPSIIIPYKINTFKTVNIGIISLLTPTTKEKILPSNIEGLEFSSSFELVQDEVNKLKDKTDFIVLLSHLNTESNEFSSQREPSGFYVEKILSQVKGIDLAIIGHLHLKPSLNTVINKTPIFFAWEHLKYIGILNIKKKLFKDWNISLNGIDYDSKDSIKQDPDIIKLIENLNKKFEDRYRTVIGSSSKEIPLLKTKMRLEQTDLGRYFADIFKKGKDVDLSLINAGAIRNGIKKGNLTENDVLLIFPFKNKMFSIEVTGEELKELIEQSYSIYPNLHSGMLQFSSNLSLKLDLNKKPYTRVLNIKISGKPLDKNKKYKVLVNNFLKEGGDGYTVFKDKKVIEDFGYMHEDLKNYIKNNSPISL